MTPQTLHLPDGQKFTVTPVFAGMGFRSHEHNNHFHPFPVGWTTVMHTEEERVRFKEEPDDGKKRTKPFTQPTLQNDTLFISSISNPSNSEFKPAASPTRQIAMMLWVSLYWYFSQPEPPRGVDSTAARNTPDAAKPAGDWKIRICRDGVLRSRNLIPKLERMGLIATEDTAVGTSIDDSGDSWTAMFVSKRMFWQTPARLFLFALQPLHLQASPSTSRPGSPMFRDSGTSTPADHRRTHSRSPSGRVTADDLPGAPMPTTLASPPPFPVGPFFSNSHLPTYYPPHALQYVFTEGLRHPLRPKPPRMGEVFYTRFVDSIGQFLSFRVASASNDPVPYLGPVGPNPPEERAKLTTMSDIELLQSWFANPRVSEFWGPWEPEFLSTALRSRHSFPVIGLWDGVPFGYFELYWVKEDILGRHVGGEIGDWDRGVHIMIGEEWARGRVPSWLSSLVHYCLTEDYRTMNICLEPRVDNKRILRHLDECGFSKERHVSFPHKQAWYVRLRREFWDGPAL